MMLPTELATVAVAVIAAGGAWASQRAAAKASRVNTNVAGRLEAEKEAYERARAFDIQTIERQDQEIRDLREQIAVARERIARLESGQPSKLERMLRERLEDDSGDKEQ
jgi:TolA-binding protein